MKIELFVDGERVYINSPVSTAPIEHTPPTRPVAPPVRQSIDLDISQSSRRTVRFEGAEAFSRTFQVPDSQTFAVRISYQPAAASRVRMRLLDANGREVMKRQSLFILSHTLNVGDELEPNGVYTLELSNFSGSLRGSADEQIAVLRR